MPTLDTTLLVAYVIVAPVLMAAAAYGFMWMVLCLVRVVPLIGRKHRHPEWDQLNK